MRRELNGAIIVALQQAAEQPREVREVAGDEHVARLGAQAVGDPFGRIVGLKVARR